MKTEFKFDADSGTMVPVGGEVKIVQEPVTTRAGRLQKKSMGRAPVNAPQKPVVQQPVQIVKLKRSKTLTPVQLVNDQGMPEAYLAPVNTGVLMFREGQDYDVYQIADERSKKVLAYIGGYALQMCFNMQELNTMEKIEQCLEGLKKLFRHQIMSQVLPTPDTKGK